MWGAVQPRDVAHPCIPQGIQVAGETEASVTSSEAGPRGDGLLRRNLPTPVLSELRRLESTFEWKLSFCAPGSSSQSQKAKQMGAEFAKISNKEPMY